MMRNLIKERDGKSSAMPSTMNTTLIKPNTAKNRHKSLHNMFINQWELQKEYATHMI